MNKKEAKRELKKLLDHNIGFECPLYIGYVGSNREELLEFINNQDKFVIVKEDFNYDDLSVDIELYYTDGPENITAWIIFEDKLVVVYGYSENFSKLY
jgi:hypothetical protein